VVLPGWHPKWLAGSNWHKLAMLVRSSVMQADRILVTVLISAKGQYAPSFI